MEHLNIEIKAHCCDHERIRFILKENGAKFVGVDHQIDTYFNVNNGRLKLREGNIENHLIHYSREDIAGPKQSNITLFESDPNSALKDILIKSLSVLIVVDKKREIYWIDNVKFHLDKVEGLGTFIEIEAISENLDIGREQLLAQCNHYLRLFGINDSDLLSISYSDMLLNKKLL